MSATNEQHLEVLLIIANNLLREIENISDHPDQEFHMRFDINYMIDLIEHIIEILSGPFNGIYINSIPDNIDEHNHQPE